MFGIFSKKTYQPSVTPEDKDWIENNIIWFIEVFGFDKLKEQPFISPTTVNFPYNNLKDPDQFQKLFEQLCNYWDLNPKEIIVKFFDDIKSKQWTTIYWISRSGYLPSELISYANALICYITEHDENKYYSLLNNNTKDLFKNDIEFLTNTNDTLLTKEKLSESNTTYKIAKQIADCFENRNYDEAIKISNELLETNPKNIAALTNIGYSFLQQKKYQEAIEYFTRSIDIDPYWDYPYNNRGYCKLQLGDLGNAYTDLHHSFEMSPDNSFSWRNLGAYYLKTNEFEKALRHFEEAEKIDPKTELINFYLAKTHLKMGNMDKSKQYFDKSMELKEQNDSTTK